VFKGLSTSVWHSWATGNYVHFYEMFPCPDEIWLQTCILKKRAANTVSPATSIEICFKKHAVLGGVSFFSFSFFPFLQITKVCLQGMVSKNEKHLATFRNVLLALSLNSIIYTESLRNRRIYIYNLLIQLPLRIKPAER